MDARTICGLLAEPERLRVFSAIVLGAGALSDISEHSGVSAGATGKALRRLQDSGLVAGEEGKIVAVPELFKDVVRQAVARQPVEVLDPDSERDILLRSVIRNGRIKVMPTASEKVQIVLEHLVNDFDFDTRYPETEVNAILNRRFDDHAALRRYLVDAGLLNREAGQYWRVSPT